YVDEHKNLNRIIKQKNSLLKENLAVRKYSPAELKNMVDIWNEELIETGTKIIIRRAEFVYEFRTYIEDKFRDIVDNAYVPILNYESELLPEGNKADVESI